MEKKVDLFNVLYPIFRIIPALVLGIVSFCSGQTPIEIGPDFKRREIDPEVYIFSDTSKMNKDVLSPQTHFLPFHKNYPTGDYFHWITFRLENTGAEPVDLTLDFQGYADSISFFIVGDSGLVSIDSPQSWMTPRSERIYPQYRFAVFNFTLNPKKPVKVFIQLLRRDGATLVLPMVLFKKIEFEKMYGNDAVFHGF